MMRAWRLRISAQDAIEFFIRLVLAGIMFIIFFTIIKIVTTAFHHVLNNPKRPIADARFGRFMVMMLKVLLWMQVVPMLVNQIQIGVQSVVAFIGAISLSIGLSVRDIAMNVSYGVVLILDKPFQLGDLVEVAGEKGIVRELGLISTSILAPDGRIMQLTNTQVFCKPIINFTKYGKIRLECKFKLVYGSDLLLIRQICIETARKIPKVLDDSPVGLIVRELSETGLTMALRYYVLPEDQLSAVWEVNEAVLGALMDARVMFAVWPPGLGQSLRHLAKARVPGLNEVLGSDDSETDEEDIDLDMSKDLVDAAAGVTALTE